MKSSRLLVITLAAALTFVVGCQNPKPRVTQLGAGSSALAGDSLHKQGNFNTDPLALNPGGDGVTGVPGAGFGAAELSDDSALADRDQDRSAFANETVYFDYDQANVKADEASKLDQVAGAFRAKGAGFDLLIEGHCDERGTEEYNRSLGERRALAIRELLMRAGVDGRHVFTRSFGKDKPASVGHDDQSWSRNRRGEFVLVLPKKITTTQNTQ